MTKGVSKPRNVRDVRFAENVQKHIDASKKVGYPKGVHVSGIGQQNAIKKAQANLNATKTAIQARANKSDGNNDYINRRKQENLK